MHFCLFVCFNNFIYLFIFGCSESFLLCRPVSISGEQGLCFVTACKLLIAVASLVEGHRLQVCGLQQLIVEVSRLTAQAQQLWAQLLHSTWDLPRRGTELASPALAGGFFTNEPPGKPSFPFFKKYKNISFLTGHTKVDGSICPVQVMLC